MVKTKETKEMLNELKVKSYLTLQKIKNNQDLLQEHKQQCRQIYQAIQHDSQLDVAEYLPEEIHILQIWLGKFVTSIKILNKQIVVQQKKLKNIDAEIEKLIKFDSFIKIRI